MESYATTGVEEKEQWRERIVRALQELRGGDDALRNGPTRRDDSRDDGGAESTKL